MSERVTDERLAAVLSYALKASDDGLDPEMADLALDLRDCRAALESERARSAMLREALKDALEEMDESRGRSVPALWSSWSRPAALVALDATEADVQAWLAAREAKVREDERNAILGGDQETVDWIGRERADARREALEEAARIADSNAGRSCTCQRLMCSEAILKALAGEVKP